VKRRRTDFQDFLFLLLDRVVDLLYVLIGQLLDFRFRFAQFVFGQFRIFLQFLQLFVGIPPEPTDVHFRVFSVLLANFGQLLATFLGERRQRYANDLAVVRRRDAQTRHGDGLFDFLDELRLPGLNREKSGFGGREIGDLSERRHCAVIIDTDIVQQGNGRPTGSQPAQIPS